MIPAVLHPANYFSPQHIYIREIWGENSNLIPKYSVFRGNTPTDLDVRKVYKTVNNQREHVFLVDGWEGVWYYVCVKCAKNHAIYPLNHYEMNRRNAMKRMTKVLSLFLVVAMVLSFAACVKPDPGTTGSSKPSSGPAGNAVDHTVTVKTAGGMPMAGIDVYIYTDNTLSDMKLAAKTDDNGVATFSMEKSDKYAIALSGVPKGYMKEESYAFSGTGANITLTSSLIQGEEVNGVTFELGDVMYDFEVTTPAVGDQPGQVLKLSEVLAEKKMVMLNFWYSTCSWCVTEFPILEESYQQYNDKMEILGLNSYPTDDDTHCVSMKENQQLSFPLAKCDNDFAPANFGAIGYPTSVVIDRYGVICLIHEGAFTSSHVMKTICEYFTSDEYEQKLITSPEELVSSVKPNVEMPSSETIENLINQEGVHATYRPEEEGESAEYAWPFVEKEFNGEKVLGTSNAGIDSSFSIIYMDVELKKGQAVGFDYFASTEQGSDRMVVIVNGEDIVQISGISQDWEACYPWVAEEDGTYEVALVYLKDGSTNEGDDTIYIKNVRVIDAKDIDVDTLIPHQAALKQEDGTYQYIEYFYSEKDSYYHVGSADGPLLLVDLMGYTQFNDSEYLWQMAADKKLILNDHDYAVEIEQYANYSINGTLYGYCPVTQELLEVLQKVDEILGFDDEDSKEWLKLCSYYQPYGPSNKHLEDPIKGLAPFSAYEAVLGVGVESNQFVYDRPLMPRGKLFRFVPQQSGVYRITSDTAYTEGLDAWLYNEDYQLIYTYDGGERMYDDPLNVSLVAYMEAGHPYYFNIALWDSAASGTVPFNIEYVGKTYDLFTVASPGAFTFVEDTQHIVAGGIEVALGEDGIYYHVLRKDENGNPVLGSKLYADFLYLTSIFDSPIADYSYVNDKGETKIRMGLISKGGFNFTRTENDEFVLAYLSKNNGDAEATKEELKRVWGEGYADNYEEYHVDDVLQGIYHGKGEDRTAEAEAFLNAMIKSNGPDNGCVIVTEELADLLQELMDKYTFPGVETSWRKLCYYYRYLGTLEK